jgi:hypothetical protein
MSNGTNNDTNFGKQDGVDLRDLFTAQIENIHTLIDANDQNYNQRFDNVIQATKSALDAADRAVNKAEVASEKRFDAVNEFRAQQQDIINRFMPRNEVLIMVDALNTRIENLEKANVMSQGTSKGLGNAWAYIVGGIALVSSVIALLLNAIRLFSK